MNDNGNTGTGGDLISSDSTTINITAVNDAPVLSATSSILTLVSNAGTSGAVAFTEAALAAYFADPEGSADGVNALAVLGSSLTSATGTSIGAGNVGTVGTITITDNSTLSGSFSVTATDGSATSSAATVNFTNSATTTTSLTAAGTGDSIIVNDQTTGATMTGGSGADYIIGNSGSDIIVGAQNDKVLDGGGGTDTLRIGANFTSTSDAQIVNIENVTLTAAATVDLSNQTEGFTITGSASADSITGGGGSQTIIGAQNDTLLDGGGGTDTLNVGASFTSASDAQIANIERLTLTTAVTLNLSNQTEDFFITGSSGIDSITAGGGDDTIVGAVNDSLLDGGGGTDTLNVAANFTSTSNAQIANIENIVLTASGRTLNLSNQTEDFTITGLSGSNTITGGSGDNSITGGSGADTIVGAQNDTLLDGSGGTDTLRIGANFTSTSDAQIANIENITLTTAGLALDLSNQTEAFNITGSTGVDTITGGSGGDTITGGLGADVMTGGSGADRFIIATSQSLGTLGGSGNAGTITGYDIITDFTTGSDTLDLQGTTTAAANNAGTSNSSNQSTLMIGGQTLKSHAISNGIITFDDSGVYSSALNLTSLSNVAAAVSYLSRNDIGTTGTTVAFTATISGVAHTFVYEQLSTGTPSSTAQYLLVDLSGVTLTSGGTSVTSMISAGRIAPAGASGEAINLAMHEPAGHVGAVTVTVAGVPEGWSLSEGIHNADGTWTAVTHNVNDLSITSPSDFTGAMAFDVKLDWTNADGSIGSTTLTNNVEAYAYGNPIFALAGDDNLTGSSANDLMVFAQPIGNDVVKSFDVAHDQVDLLGFAGASNYADVLASLVNDPDGNALLTLGEGMSITFVGVDKGALSEANFLFNQQPVTINSGNMLLGNGSVMPFAGIIENTGTISLESTTSVTELQIIQHGLTLQGGGSVLLSDSPGNLIFGTDAGVTLTNVDNLISGAGQIGGGQLTLVNYGTISATGFNALDIDTGDTAIVNSGVLKSSGAGGLVVHGDVVNSGVLWANGGNVTVEGDVTGSGSAVIDGNGTFVFEGLFSNTVALNDTASGTLMLSQSAQFSGAITGLDGNDFLFLGDISAETATLKYTENADGNGGVLTIADATHSANITLQGQYDELEFQLSGHATGGTTITVVPHNDHLV